MKLYLSFIIILCCTLLTAQGTSSRSAPPTIRPGVRTTNTTTNTSETDVSNRPINPIEDVVVAPVVHPLPEEEIMPDIGSALVVGGPVTIDEGFDGSLDDYLFITNRKDFFHHGINLASAFQREEDEESAANQMKGAMATINYRDTYKVRRLFNIQAVLAHLFYRDNDLVRADAQIVNALTVEKRWLALHDEVNKETLDMRLKIGHDFYGLEFYSIAGKRFTEALSLARSAQGLDPAVRQATIAHAQYMLARLNTIWGKTETALHLFESSLKEGSLTIRNSNTDLLFKPDQDPAFLPLKEGPRWQELKSTYNF